MDESGTTSETEHNITLASAWCAPTTKEGYQTVLRHTVDIVKNDIKEATGVWPNELHFSGGLKRHCDTIFEKLNATTHEDLTIHKKNLPWPGRPLVYRVSSSSPKMEASLPGYEKRTFHKNIRARGIISLLMPLVLYEDNPTIEASVILDADVWKESISICEECFEDTLSNDHATVTFSCENSKRVPGLQIADVAAGIVRHHAMDGGGKKAYYELNNAMIHRLGEQKIISGVRPL